MEVPPPVSDELGQYQRTALFFRVLSTRPGALRVELWERGQFYGARTITLSRGNAQLYARRIALGAAELARRLRQRRLFEARAAERAQQAEAEEAALCRTEAVRIAFQAEAKGAAVGPGELWLVGPGMGAELRFGSGARLGLAAALLGGQPVPLSGTARWLELALSPGYSFELGSDLRLDVGLTAAAASLRLSDAAVVDDVADQSSTWSARGGGWARLELGLGQNAGLSLGPDLGVVLRRASVVDRAGERHRLGGAWLGGSLRVTLDPWAATSGAVR